MSKKEKNYRIQYIGHPLFGIELYNLPTEVKTIDSNSCILIFRDNTKWIDDMSKEQYFCLVVSKKIIDILKQVNENFVQHITELNDQSLILNPIINIANQKESYDINNLQNVYVTHYCSIDLYQIHNKKNYKLGFLNTIKYINSDNKKYFIKFHHCKQQIAYEISELNYLFLSNQLFRLNSIFFLYWNLIISIIDDIFDLHKIVEVIVLIENDTNTIVLEDLVTNLVIQATKIDITYFILKQNGSYKYCNKTSNGIKDAFTLNKENSIEYYQINKLSVVVCEDEFFNNSKKFANILLEWYPDMVRVLSITKEINLNLLTLDIFSEYLFTTRFYIRQTVGFKSNYYFIHTYYDPNVFNIETISKTIYYESYEGGNVFNKPVQLVPSIFSVQDNIDYSDFAIGSYQSNLFVLIPLKNFNKDITKYNTLFDTDLTKNKELVDANPEKWIKIKIDNQKELEFLTSKLLILNALYHFKNKNNLLNQENYIITKTDFQVVSSRFPIIKNKYFFVYELNNLILTIDKLQYFLISYKNKDDFYNEQTFNSLEVSDMMKDFDCDELTAKKHIYHIKHLLSKKEIYVKGSNKDDNSN